MKRFTVVLAVLAILPLALSGCGKKSPTESGDAALKAPSDLVAPEVSGTRAHLTWKDNSPNEDGFIIERSADNNKIFVEIARVGGNVINYIDKSIDTGRVYYYRVCAYNANGNSAYSNEARIGCWAVKWPMPTARYGLAIGVVNSKIYAVGGKAHDWLSIVEEYDPATDTWTTKTPTPTARGYLAIGVVDGKIYAIGGYNSGELSMVEEYDPSFDK